MKAVFGIVALVIVLAVVGSIARKQLQAVGATASGAAAPHGAIAVDPNGATVAQQAREMQERARANTARALEQGAERNQRADP